MEEIVVAQRPRSNRLRCWMRGGLLVIIFLVGRRHGDERGAEQQSGAGTLLDGDFPAGFAALGGVTCTPLQVKPASNS